MTTLTISLALLALQAGAHSDEPVPGAQVTDQEGTQDQESPAERARREREEQRQRGAAGQTPVVLGPDGKPLEPGVLPADAAPAARAQWQALREAVLAPEPVQAFDLSFFLVQRQETPQSNSVQARIRFLAPDFVRSVLTQSQRELLRGPSGDWLLDNGEKVKLVGREGIEDRKQLDEIVGIARNFVALTDPASLRIAALEVRDECPQGLPEAVSARARTLRWLAVTSPDFRLYQTPPRPDGAPPPMFRALLGIDPGTNQVELALIHEAGAPSVTISTSLLVHLQNQRRQGGFLLPGTIHVYQIDNSSQPPRFRTRPSSELTLSEKGIDLRPTFTGADFVP